MRFVGDIWRKMRKTASFEMAVETLKQWVIGAPFFNIYRLKKAVRFNTKQPSITPVSIKDNDGKLLEYELLSLPHYLAKQ